MKIEQLNLARDGERFYAVYRAYIAELADFMRGYGKADVQPQPWWANDPDSLVHVAWVADQLAGFVINGWGSRVDRDTTSEILEFYVTPACRRQGIGRRLATLGFAHLFGRAGFQVYFENQKAEHFWNQVLAENGLRYTTYPAIENNVPVIKYRFTRPTRSVV